MIDLDDRIWLQEFDNKNDREAREINQDFQDDILKDEKRIKKMGGE
jgi:hypothetical protein